MKVSLRKANALQKAIKDAISHVGLSKTVEVSVHTGDHVAVMNTAREQTLANLVKVERIETILFSMRRAVGDANAEVGITKLMAEDVQLQRGIERRTALLAGAKVADADAVLRSITSCRARIEKGEYGAREEVKANILHQSDIDALKSSNLNATRRRNQIADNLLDLNVRTEIDILDADYEFLQNEGVI